MVVGWQYLQEYIYISSFLNENAVDTTHACAYPKLSAKDIDFSLGLLFPESPLHQVLPILPWEGHVSLCHGWVGSASQDVRFCLVV